MPPVLTAPRPVVLHFTNFRLTDVVRETLGRFVWSDRVVLDQDLREDADLKKDLIVHADASFVADAIFALVTSSVNALPGATGTLRVRTGKMRCPRAFLDSRHVFFGKDREEANYAYFEIFDTGTGLNEEARRNLFAEPDPPPDGTTRRNGMHPVRRLAQTHPCAVEVQAGTQRSVTVRLLFSLARTESGKRRRMIL